MSTRENLQTGAQRFALYTSSRGNYFFNEIRDLIADGLKELGFAVDIRDDRTAFAQADWHLVIAPHEFFELGNGPVLARQKWPANLVIFNTEQPSSHWQKLSAKHFDRARAIWDIDFESTLRNTRNGHICDYLPLGYVVNSPMFRDITQLPLHDETRQLSAEIRNGPGFELPFSERPIDLLFLGHGSARRENYFARHGDKLKKLRCFFHKPSAIAPLIPGQTTQMNTSTSVGLAQRSKILLNIHHGVDKYFEWHRIALLGVAQRALVITEPCSVAPPLRANIDYVEAPLEELCERVEYYTGSVAGREEAQRIIDHGFTTFTQNCRLSEMLRPLVERLNAAASTAIDPAARFFPVTTVDNKPHSTPPVCVVTPDLAGVGPHAASGSTQVQLAETLAHAGHPVTLLHTEAQYGEAGSLGYWRKHFAAIGIDYVPLPRDLKAPVDASEACLRSYETYHWLKSRSFQAVHLPETHGIGFYSLLAKNQALAFDRTLFSVSVQGPRSWRRFTNQELLTNPYEIELDFMEKECVRRADALVTPTRWMQEWLEKNNWILPTERNVRPDLRDRTILSQNSPTRIHELVYLGPLARCPGLTLFCDALDRLGPEALRKFTVTFCDDETMPSNSARYLQERSRKWTFTWQVAADSPAAVYKFIQGKGRLVVIPAPSENSPLPLRRCLALGLPFLAVRGGGVPELIATADHERSLCAGTGAALAEALQRAMKDGAVSARPAEDCDGKVKQWLDWHTNWLHKDVVASNSKNPSTVATPLVSVCLVHFNRPEYLVQSLSSLRAQDYKNFEVVLVDDGSARPDAIKFLSDLEPEFQKRGWQIVRQPNSYLGAARNTGARHARGEYLMFMDDDNFAKPHEISTFVRAALKSGAEILTSAMDLFTGTEAPNPDAKPKTRWIFLGPAAATGAIRNCFGDANGFIRRDTFLKVGGFTEDYGITHEDWEFYARAVLRGCRLETMPEALFWYRTAEQSMIRNTSPFANLQRSLRPYLESVPDSLRDLVHLLQGYTCSPPAEVLPAANQQPLVNLHRKLIAMAQQFIRSGDHKAAETLLLEIVQSSQATGQPLLVLQTLLAVGKALIDSGRAQIAIQILESALTSAKTLCDAAGINEAQKLLASARGSDKAAVTRPSRQTPESAAAAARLLQAPVPSSAPKRNDSAMPKPAVSIIIPTFNKLELTRGCLDALRKNTNAASYELIIVDNASTDGTLDFLRGEAKAGRLRTILNGQNMGFAKACNQGAAAAAGKLLLFLNNDTEVQPGWLEPLVETADSKPEIVAVGSKLLFPDRTIQHAGVVVLDDRQLPDPLVARHIHYRKPEGSPEANQPCAYKVLTAACVLVKKAAFEIVGGFDEEYWNGYEDVDLCFKLGAEGGMLIYQPRSVVLHFESQSGPERFRKVAHNTQRLHQKWIGKINPDYVVAHDGTVSRFISSKDDHSQVKTDGQGSSLPRASIIVLAHNQLNDTRLCLASIEQHTRLSHELILVDNNSTDGTTDFFQQYAATRSHVRVVLNRTNLGFAGGNNQGLAIARGENILLLNNDTVVTEQWLERLLSVLERHPDAGLVGPVSNSVSGPQLVMADYTTLEGMPRFAARWSGAHAGETTEAARLVGFCLLMRREVVEKIGGLDTQYGNGNFEDDDLCIRAGLAGFKMRIAWDCFIHHTGGQTFKGAKMDYRASMSRNWDLFKTKWAMPKDLPLEKGYRFPAAVPPGVALKFGLTDIAATHSSSLEGRCWTEGKSVQPAQKPTVIQLPPCALLGRLTGANEKLRQKKLSAAWEETLAAIQARPFHPEAFLLLGEIAQAAGDAISAIRCAKHARQLAPDWKPAKKFLNGSLRGTAKPAWLILPSVLAGAPAQSAPRLTVCLIVKNEEQFLGRCLASVCALASQIIVVDTGSTDRTVEIAREHGAEVHHFEWCDDFAAARNVALEHATGDWVLALDADEELAPGQAEVLAQEMQSSAVMAFRIPILDEGREDEGCSYVPRLFRNAPGIFFLGRLHEQAFSSIEVRCKEWSLRHELGKTRLLHHGYTKELVESRQKVDRNLRLLARAMEELPDEPNLVMNLGMELIRSGQRQAGLTRYWEAIRLMTALPPAQIVPELRETLLSQLTTHLIADKDFAAVEKLWQMPLAKTGGMTASHHFGLGLAQMELKQWADAAEQMRQCLVKRGQPSLSPVNKEILKAGPNHCLALCLSAVKQSDAAARSFTAALEEDPSSRRVRFDFARFQAGRGQLLEALQLLNGLVCGNPHDVAMWELGGRIALSRPEFLEFACDWTGEAVKHLPEYPALIGQRAEALLLAQNPGAALPMWMKVRVPGLHRHTAAVVLCELLTGAPTREVGTSEEASVSQEMLKWYRQLIAVGAHSTVNQLHERMDAARVVVPGFVRAWETATTRVRETMAA